MTETRSRKSKAKGDMKQRILTLCDALEISQSKFSVSIGKSAGYLSNMPGDISCEVLKNIIDAYPQVSMYWLLTGEGEPFIGNNVNKSGTEDLQLISRLESEFMKHFDEMKRRVCQADDSRIRIKALNDEVTSLNREIGRLQKELENEKDLTDSLKKQLAACLKPADDNSPVPAE